MRLRYENRIRYRIDGLSVPERSSRAGYYWKYQAQRQPSAEVFMIAWSSRGASELRIRVVFGSDVPVSGKHLRGQRPESVQGYWIDYSTYIAFRDGQAASSALKRLAQSPESLIPFLRQTGPSEEVMRALEGPIETAFAALKPVSQFDGVDSSGVGAQALADLGRLQAAVESQRAGDRSGAKTISTTVQALQRVPMQAGYAAAVKGIIKLAEDSRVFGVAAGRIASGAPSGAAPRPPDAERFPSWVIKLIPEWTLRRRVTKWGLTQDSIDYLNRLVRRRFKEWARIDNDMYVEAGLALLGQLDAEGGVPEAKERAFAANYLLYGRAVRDVGHGRHEQVPPLQVRQSARFDAHPAIWDAAIDKVAKAWALVKQDVDTFTWMTLVLGAERARGLDWSVFQVDTGLRSSNPMCQALAREQLESRGVEALRPNEADPERWRAYLRLTPHVHSFAARRTVVDSCIEALRPTTDARWPEWLEYFSVLAPYLDGAALERLASAVVAASPARSLSAKRFLIVRLIRSGDPMRAALGWLALTDPKFIRTSPETFVAGIPYAAGSYTWNSFTPLTDDIEATGGCALRSGLSAETLWSLISLACSPASAGAILGGLVPGRPDLARLLWRHLDEDVMESLWMQVDRGRLVDPLRQAVREIGPRSVAAPGARQRAFLEAWLGAEPREWLAMPSLVEAVSRSGDPTLVQAARDLVLRAGAMESYWLAFAEAQSPAAVSVVSDFLRDLPAERRREAVLSLLDSAVPIARQLGWEQYSLLPEGDQARVTEGLLEHRSPDVVDRVARFLDGSDSPRDDALKAFDRSVLLSRRSLRGAKAAVQHRWATSNPADIDRDVLVELALGSSRVDSDWAWQQLARIDSLSETAGNAS